jgi:hypothetical protein
MALAGQPGFVTVPMAFSNGDGTFRVTNSSAGEFPGWAIGVDAKVVTGDFNGDGRTDMALTGQPGFVTVPVAFSNGDGTFTITNSSAGEFPGWAIGATAKVVTGDFNNDGRTDIALNQPGFVTVPVAFSNGDGTFRVTNAGAGEFPGWAAAPGAKMITGDFNKDGRTDIALAGGLGWTTIPLALSAGDGTFNVSNQGAGAFPIWAAPPTT